MTRISGGAGYAGSAAARRRACLERLRLAAASAVASNAEDLPAMAAPPAVTTSASATAALTRVYPFGTAAALYRVSGGIPAADTSVAGQWFFPVTKIGNGTTANGNLSTWTGDAEDNQTGWSLTLQTDADVIEFRVKRNITAGRAYRFLVDGQYVDKAGTDPQPLSGSTSYIKLDFSAQTPARRMRTIAIEGAGSNQHAFWHAAVAPTASIAHPGATRTDLVALFAGDSFTEGQNLTAANTWLAWPHRSAKRLGIARLYDLAIGTTGYVNTGSGNRRKLVDQIAHDWNRPALASPDLVVMANGYNDKAAAATTPAILATIRTQALASWQGARTMFPDALIVVAGVFGGKTGPNADTIVTENGLKTQFDEWSDPFALWLPVSTDPSPWQFGTGNVASPAGDGNSDLTTSNDGTHPSDYGQDVISQRFCTALRAGLARMPS